MKTYNFGIIGAGMIAEKHIRSLKKTGRAEISWVVRNQADKLESFKTHYRIPNGSVDYHDILNDPGVDAVIITTPPESHFRIFMDSLKAGKHILLEKPAGMNLTEVGSMIREAKKYPHLKISDCSGRHSRLQPKFRKAKEIIDSGALGEIYYIHHNSASRQGRPGIEYHPQAKWFMDKDIAGGGPLLDQGVYDLSFHLGLLNDVPQLEKINSILLKSGLDNYDPGDLPYNVEESFVAMLDFSGGIKYFWERANHANVEVPNESRIYGTRGGIKLNFCTWDPNIIYFYDLDENNRARTTKIEISTGSQDDDFALIEHYIDVLDGKTEPVMPLERAGKHLDIIWRCYNEAKN